MCRWWDRFVVLFSSLLCLTLVPDSMVMATDEPLMEKLLRFDLIIDVGHGGIDGGASVGTILEKDLNLEISSRLYAELQRRGYQVGITRLHDYALSDDSPFHSIRSRHKRDLLQRQMIANEIKPKVFLSIHTNYSSSRSTRGPVIIHQYRGESFLLAQWLQQHLNQTAAAGQIGYASRRYHLLQTVQSPAMIVEVGYMSHPIERQKLVQPTYQQRIATAMSDAIDLFFLVVP